MNSEILTALIEDESKRDDQWAQRMIKLLVQEATPIITKTEYDKRADVLFGRFDQLMRDKLFSGELMTKIKDKLNGDTVYLFERIRNSIIDERTSSNLTINVNSLDPGRAVLKEKDKSLLKSRKVIEGIVNQITQNSGMPEMKVTKDDFHGNIDEFDDMGMDESDQDNVKDFFEKKWGLQQELLLQEPINHIFRINEVVNKYDRYINDILICLTDCSQVFPDEEEGKVKIQDLRPYEVAVLHPTGENDEKGAQGFLVRKETNIRGLIRRFGSDFSLSDNYAELLKMFNVGRSVAYEGIWDGGDIAFGNLSDRSKVCGLNDFLDFPISYAYGELRVANNVTKLQGTTPNGNKVYVPFNKKTSRHDGWNLSVKSKEDTYRFYFLDVNATTPKIIKWGKLYMQPTEGVNDEYSGFSILVNRRMGVPVVDILRPYYNIMHVCFTMFEMLVNDIKPDGYIYNYDNLVTIAEHVSKAKDAPTDVLNAINNLLLQFEDSPNRFAVTPTDDEGNILGGDPMGGIKRAENGLNKSAPDLLKIMDWCEAKAEKALGTQGLDVSEPRDGYKVSLENRKRSRASTQFIDFILLNHLKDISITTLSYVQDIVKYPETMAYKHLSNLIGEEKVKQIKKIKKSVHRYGVFLDTFNNDISLQEIRDLARADMTQGRITLEQYLFISKVDNLNAAVFYLAQERKAADKQKLKDQQSILAQQDQNAQNEHLRRLELEDRKGEWLRQRSISESAGYVNAARINAAGALERQKLSEEGQSQRETARAVNNIDKIAEKANAEARQPLD